MATRTLIFLLFAVYRCFSSTLLHNTVHMQHSAALHGAIRGPIHRKRTNRGAGSTVSTVQRWVSNNDI